MNPGGLAGIFAPICTPFAADERVDYGALRANLERYGTSGLHGFLALGSNGENRSLTEEERRYVLATILRWRAPDQVVLAGALYEAQRDTESFLAIAADLGADFGLVLPPSYFRASMTDEVLATYYLSLADQSPLPIVLYNAPGFGALPLSPALVRTLAAHPRIVGIKDSAGAGIESFLELQGDGFAVLAGSAKTLSVAMRRGSPGGAVSLANSFPGLALDLWASLRDEQPGADLISERVGRVNQAISGAHGVAGVKAAMTLAGYRGGIPRRPLRPLPSSAVAQLAATLRDEGLLQ